MLKWELIDNDKVFQRLTNHLFALECHSPGFIPSSPYIGADGAWDGAFEGVFEGEKGVFSIQAKWTQKSFDDAAAYLRQEIKKEIRKALGNKVNHLKISTNAELRVEHITQMESLKPKELQTLRVWHRENLAIRIDRQPFIRHLFFGNAQFPAFVPPNIYMDAFESKLLPVKTLGRSSEFEKVRRLLADKNCDIVVVHAPGGHGKSHFLNALSQKLNKRYKTKEVWFIRPGVRSLQNAIQDELVRGRKYILFLDDADRFLEDVKALVLFVRAEKNFKVVLSTRTAGLSLIKDQFVSSRFNDFSSYELLELPEKILERILCQAAQRPKIQRAREIIRGLNHNPYLIVQYGRKYKGDLTKGDLDKVFEKLVNDFRTDIDQILRNLMDKDMQAKLLSHLATIVPFHFPGEMLETLSNTLDIDEGRTELVFRKLVKGKTLRNVGGAIRFDPDMMGDIFLSDAIAQDSVLAKILVNKWYAITPHRTIANLAAAFPYGECDVIQSVLRTLVNEWIIKCGEHGAYKRQENLENIRPASLLVTGNIIKLIRAYLSTPVKNERSLNHVTLDDFGPIIESIGRHPDYQIEVLELLIDLAEVNLSARYNSYKNDSLVKSFVSPLSKSPTLIEEVLCRLIGLCESGSLSKTQAYLAATAASEMMAAAYEYHNFLEDEDKLTIGYKVLRDTSEVNRLRDLGLKIFGALLSKDDHPYFQILALEIAESIGKRLRGEIDEKNIPIAERLAKDRSVVLKSLRNIPMETESFAVLSKLEDLLFKWWANDKSGCEDALGILKKIPRSPEYRFFKRHADPDFFIDDMDRLIKEAPKMGVWNWWWEHYHKKVSFGQDIPELKNLAKDISEIYRDVDGIFLFLKEMNEAIAPYRHVSSLQLVRYWVDLNPSPFIDLSMSPKWMEIPTMFKGQISSGIAKHRKEHIKEVEREVLDSLTKTEIYKLNDFTRLLSENEIVLDDFKNTFLEIGKKGSTVIRAALIVQCLYLVMESKDKCFLLEIIINATYPPLDEHYINELAFCLHAMRDWDCEYLEQEKEFKKYLSSLLAQFEKLEYHAIEILEYCLNQKIDLWLQFFENRLTVASEIREVKEDFDRFITFPYDGLEPMCESVKSYSDFCKLVDKVNEWNERNDTLNLDPIRLLTPIRSLNFEHGTEYLMHWLNDKFDMREKDEFSRIMEILTFLEIDDLDIEIYLRLLEIGDDLDMFEKAKSCFLSLSGISHLIIFEMGNDYLINSRKELCERILDSNETNKPGIRFFIRECIERLEKIGKVSP